MKSETGESKVTVADLGALIDAIAAAKLRFREAYAEASRGVIDAVAAAELHKVWRKFTETPR